MKLYLTFSGVGTLSQDKSNHGSARAPSGRSRFFQAHILRAALKATGTNHLSDEELRKLAFAELKDVGLTIESVSAPTALSEVDRTARELLRAVSAVAAAGLLNELIAPLKKGGSQERRLVGNLIRAALKIVLTEACAEVEKH